MVSTLSSSMTPVLTRFLSTGHNMEEVALWGKHLAQFHCTFSPTSCQLGTTWRRQLSGLSTFRSSTAPVLIRFLLAGHNIGGGGSPG